MDTIISPETLISYGASKDTATQINAILKKYSPEDAWKKISETQLLTGLPFSLHRLIFSTIYPDWPQRLDTAPAIIPDESFAKTTNIYQFMKKIGFASLSEFHAWTVKNYSQFWEAITQELNILFDTPPKTVCDISKGLETPIWFQGAMLNIINSCFQADPQKTAIIFQAKNQALHRITYKELLNLTNQVANSLIEQGFVAGDTLAICMPMTVEAIAIYLGIIKMGGIVVSIAESFSTEEITTRLNITAAKAIFTQDYLLRGDKKLPLYEKITGVRAIVVPNQEKITLRPNDIAWDDFLVKNTDFTAQSCQPMDHINILFSSGTTGTPKAIPWNHTTCIKAASDAFFHQNIQSDDVLAWPTSLGWMMGPWLVFATFLNKATLALYYDLPRDADYGQFVQDAKVSMLGVVPTLVASWRESQCMKNFDWSAIKRFSDTAECSNPEDMLYLMSLAHYKPVIEYCGGTEIGGAYITSTMIEKNYPSLFTTPAMGTDFKILGDGEVALVPPAIGLSTQLLNGNHHAVYYANMPQTLRRHGDQIQALANHTYAVLGRIDDTMNLGGIKISSAEIERVIAGIPGIFETAAIAVNKNHGPSCLVIYAATKDTLDKEDIKNKMQHKINQHLNPLFKISDIIFKDELPKTASNKIMRRILRDEYHSNQ